MKYVIACIFFSIACGESTTTMKQDKAAESLTHETSVILADLPSKYSGYIGCSGCDSLELQVSLNTDLQYILDLHFIGINKTRLDSVSHETGEWALSGDKMIELHSPDGAG